MTLDSVTLAGVFTDARHSVTIDNTVTLDGATISGGSIDDTGTLSVKTSSEIENATVNGGGTLSSTASGQMLTLDTVTLDNVTLTGVFTDASTVTIDNTVTLDGATSAAAASTIPARCRSRTSSEIENATVNGGGTLYGERAGLPDAGHPVTLDGGWRWPAVFTDASTVTIDNTVTLGRRHDRVAAASTTPARCRSRTSSKIENATVNGGGTLSATVSGQDC